jgi:hypothetical protein
MGGLSKQSNKWLVEDRQTITAAEFCQYKFHMFPSLLILETEQAEEEEEKNGIHCFQNFS